MSAPSRTSPPTAGRTAGGSTNRRRRLRLVAGIVVAGFVLLQLVPYGHDHSAPPTTKRAVLPPAAAAVFAGACADCHSNATRWPWYTNIAPASLLAVKDVKGGREAMNLSRWDTPQPDLADVTEAVGGGMPPAQYTLIHSRARLSAAERRTLVAGFRTLYANDPPPPGGGG